MSFESAQLAPVATSQSLMVLSALPEASVFRPGESDG